MPTLFFSSLSPQFSHTLRRIDARQCLFDPFAVGLIVDGERENFRDIVQIKRLDIFRLIVVTDRVQLAIQGQDPLRRKRNAVADWLS